MDHRPVETDNIKKGPIVAVLMVGAFVAILNQTLLNVALPEMMNDLQITANTVQWVMTGYMLINGVLIPVTAFLIEKFSTRRLYITAMILFASGTLLCALAPGFSVLLIGRFVQAGGAAIMMPLMMNVILTIFPLEKRGTAMGWVGVAMTFAPAIGPTLSGWVVQTYSWRLLFWIALPITIVCIVLGFLFMKNVTKLTNPKVDIRAVILSTFGFGGLLYGFSIAGNIGWGHWIVIVSLVIGVIALLFFMWRELTVKQPMLDFKVFRYNMFSLTTVISMIITMAMFSGMLLLPIYLQDIRGFTPLDSGLLLLPGAIAMAIMSPITGRIFDKVGAKWLAIVGLTITTVTTWQFGHLTDSTAYHFMVFLHALRMLGLSMLMMPVMTAGLNQLPQRLNPHGTAMANTMRMMAGSIGTALLVTLMSTRTERHLQNMSVTDASIQGINDTFIVSAALSVVALVLSFFLKRVTPSQEEQGEGEALDPNTEGYKQVEKKEGKEKEATVKETEERKAEKKEADEKDTQCDNRGRKGVAVSEG